jgi:hypothetical protein
VVNLTGRVQAVCKKEICEKIEECLWESSDLSNSQPDLLESDGRVGGAFGYLGTRPLLLEKKPPDA